MLFRLVMLPSQTTWQREKANAGTHDSCHDSLAVRSGVTSSSCVLYLLFVTDCLWLWASLWLVWACG